MRRVHVHSQVAQRRVVQGMAFIRMLVMELRRRKGLRWRVWVRLVHVEWVYILERRLVHLRSELWVEAMESGNLMASMQGAFGSWQRERCAETHVERRRVEVPGLRVVDGISAARRGRVVARHVVRKHAEPIAVGIHEGGR